MEDENLTWKQKKPHMQHKQKKTKKKLKFKLHKQKNWSVQIEELVTRITPTVLDLQSSEQRRRTFREKSKNSRKVVSR